MKVKGKLKSLRWRSTIPDQEHGSPMLAAMASKHEVGGMADKEIIPPKLQHRARVAPAANATGMKPHQPLVDSDDEEDGEELHDTRLGSEPRDSKKSGT